MGVVRNPPEDYPQAIWMWPRALPLPEIFGHTWDDNEVRARFITLASQWQARLAPRPLTNAELGGRDPMPGQWLWHPLSQRVHAFQTLDGVDKDWLEITIRWDTSDLSPTHCHLSVRLEVACQCDIAHGQHTLVGVDRLAGTPRATLDAFSELLRHMDQWLAASRTPTWWRQYAGL